jgi:CRISPR/Cas system CMR-associated protein Cmr3 (group 5 of RAMP superfamily)
MLHMIERMSQIFGLGMESKMSPVKQEVEAIAKAQMQSALDKPTSGTNP